ncbi:helix-turn-helix transcriptional regulator [Propionibacteriaceae bacterium G57]|uniref:helix-turn-helix transcriptional regulator n=1 Tax=Aestuariimicrobium sp. G57 TaxID=3418485 RepID=UPI003DA76CE8
MSEHSGSAPAAQPLDELSSPVRRAIVDLLANLPALAPAGEPNRSGGLTAADLAARLDLHVTTVRHHLERLVAAGLLDQRDERSGVGRPRRHYTVNGGHLGGAGAAPTHDAPAHETYAFELLASVLAEGMASGDGPTATEAGRRWARAHAAALVGDNPITAPADSPGTWLAKIGTVIDMLDRWGYEPTLNTRDAGRTADIRLHHCPLRTLVQTHPTVACGVHRGVIEGTLEAIGESQVHVGLVPFTEPDLCIAHLTTDAQFQPAKGARP